MLVVSNSTPLIGLARIGRLDILRELFATISIPQAVRDEVVAQGRERAGQREVCEAAWIVNRSVADRAVVEFLAVSLDDGESEAIALAKETRADLLLIDDRQGRRLAKGVGIAISGTVGVLLRYHRGDPGALQTAMDDLLRSGFRLSRVEYERTLALAERGATRD